MSRRPSPNVTPFIPPLLSPNPSPHRPPGSIPTSPYASPYGTPYLPNPGAAPGYASPYAPYSTSIQPPQGLSADYTGYPQFLNPTPLAQPGHLPATHPSPWSPAHAPLPTPWATSVQLPHYQTPPQHVYYPALQPHMTPAAMPYAPFSPDPWAWPTQPQPSQLRPHPHPHPHPQPQPQPQPQPTHHRPFGRTINHSADRVDPFLPGSCYGPVLTPFLAGIVNAKMKLNPLITPLPEDGSDKPHLRWNMLYTSNYCQRSDDKSHVSWSRGREAPATFPRVTSIRVITELMPWTIDVVAQNPAMGVTCGEVIDSISDSLYRMASATEFNALPDLRKRAVSESYHYNRSVAADVPGGRLKHGMMRLDFFGKFSMYGGIEPDNEFVKKTTGVAPPCVFVLKCLKRPVLTESEAQQHRERTKSLSRQPVVSEPKSTPSTAELAASTTHQQ